MLTWVRRGALTLYPVTGENLADIEVVIKRYPERDIDFADATLIWVASPLNTAEIMTIDRGDFRGLPAREREGVHSFARVTSVRCVNPGTAARRKGTLGSSRESECHERSSAGSSWPKGFTKRTPSIRARS